MKNKITKPSAKIATLQLSAYGDGTPKIVTIIPKTIPKPKKKN